MPENFRDFMKCRTGTTQSLESDSSCLSTIIAWAVHEMPKQQPTLSVTITVDMRVSAYVCLHSNHGLFASAESYGGGV